MSKQLDKTNILNYLKEHYSEFNEKYNVDTFYLFGYMLFGTKKKTKISDQRTNIERSNYSMKQFYKSMYQEIEKFNKKVYCVPFLCTILSQILYFRTFNTKQYKIMYPMG